MQMTPVKVAPASIPTLPNPHQINTIEKKKKIVVSVPTSKSISTGGGGGEMKNWTVKQ